MVFFTLAFLCGDLLLQSHAHLPGKMIIFSLVVTCFLTCLHMARKIYANRHQKSGSSWQGRWHQQTLLLLCAVILGYLWATWYAQSILAFTLPAGAEGVPIIVSGTISDLPQQNQWGKSFIFSGETLQWHDKKWQAKTRLRLSCQHCPSLLQVGDQWQFVVKLKRIHGFANPGSFDYEAYSLQQGIRATGYIVESSQNKWLAHQRSYPLNQVRQYLQTKLTLLMPETSTAPWLMALVIGVKQGIAKQDWEVLRKTGTNHLMAIAGLHIGLVAGVVHFLTARLWRALPTLMLWMPAPLAGACAALVTAITYSILAGFSLPTQRACLMLTVVIVALLARRKINPWYAWALALLTVLLINPLSTLTESFWLSFGTLALIIYGMRGRLAPVGLWWKWGRVQWVIGFGLIPLSLCFFQECSLISFVANSIAIPWLGFSILPFCFMSAVLVAVLPTVANYLLWLADKNLAGLWMMLSWFAHWQISAFHIGIPNYVVMGTTIVACLFLLMPASMPGRWLGLIWALPLFCHQPVLPKVGEAWLTVLDVGQGLSTVVQTQHHTLVYDTGPKLSEAFDMGESVLVPYLRNRSVKNVDMLVVSHGDNDHSGGANALVNALPVLEIKTSTPDKLTKSLSIKSVPMSHCLANQRWRWDGVDFELLYPSQNYLKLGNNSSCVLRISNGVQSLLLTGDIEKLAEQTLVRRQLHALSATVLVAPHHGSKTSIYPAFVKAVQPAYVIYAAGYRNRYHFPHPSVVQCYQQLASVQLNTATTGMISFKLTQSATLANPELYRVTHRKFWQSDSDIESN